VQPSCVVRGFAYVGVEYRAMLNLKTFVCGPLATNVYLLWEPQSSEAALIDPGLDAQEVGQVAESLELRPEFIFNTHCHFDHAWLNAYYVKLWKAKLVYHKLDEPVLEGSPAAAQEYGFPQMEPSPPADMYCAEGDVFKLGKEELSVLHVPGHSPGHIALVTSLGVLAGDVLFASSIGRWDFRGGNKDDLLSSITNKLMTLPDETIVYPGHGPTTTIGEEKRSNPFLTGEIDF
jgi:hydroxyacylglutathione hydrolase